MLDGTKWFLIAEINNETDGGESPATIRSALESVRGGYNPDPDELLDVEPIQRELGNMLLSGQGDDLAENLLTDADWQEYSEGDLQGRARKGH